MKFKGVSNESQGEGSPGSAGNDAEVAAGGSAGTSEEYLSAPESRARVDQGSERGSRAPFLLVGLGGVVVVALAILALQLSDSDESEPVQPSAAASGPEFKWRFATGLPDDWTSLAKASPGEDGIKILPDGSAGYQVYSRATKLPAGTYDYSSDVRILKGGMAFGILDNVKDEFIISDPYTSSGTGGKRLKIDGTFDISKRTPISVVFSNLEERMKSEWEITSVDLKKAGS